MYGKTWDFKLSLLFGHTAQANKSYPLCTKLRTRCWDWYTII